MRIRDIMSKPVITVARTATLAEAIHRMLDAHVSGLPVVDEAGGLVGVISEGDLLRRAEMGTQPQHSRWLEWLIQPGRLASEYVRANGRLVHELMTLEPVTVDEDAPLQEAVSLMERWRIKRLPVMGRDGLVGIVTRADIIRGLAGFLAPAYEEQATSDAEIRSRILAELAAQSWAPTAALDIEVENGVVRLRGTIFDERERDALRVAAENVVGVRRVEDHLVWVEPNTGMAISSPLDERRDGAATPDKAA